MPMTFSQASTQNLINSVRDWIYPNIIDPYTTEVASKPYAGAPTVVINEPDDPALLQAPPVIAIELPVDIRDPVGVGIGDGEVWRYKQICLAVFPAIVTTASDAGSPSIESAAILQKYFDYALGTALVMPINDYSTNPVSTAVDYAYVEGQRLIRPRGHISTNSARLRHRFDYIFNLKYVAITIN